MNKILAKINNGEIVYGTWSHIPNYLIVEIIGDCGLDFIVFDIEHGPHSFSDVQQLICAAEKANIEPITRVPSNANSNILRCLDSGSKGIFVPHIDSIEKAKNSLNSMYYGSGVNNRGVATLTRAAMFNYENELQHIQTANDYILSILMLEDKAGLDILDELCQLEQLNILFVGLYDLSQSLGFNGDIHDKDFIKIFENTIKKIRDKGVNVGSYAPDAKRAKELGSLGVNFITINVDGAMLRRSYINLINQLNS